MSAPKKRFVYQLKVTLNDSKPPIWRRILVPSDVSLDRFHMILQVAMGWTNSHLHQFISGRKMYGMTGDEWGMELDLDVEDENKYKLSDLLKEEKDSLIYEYDFGDSWEHKIILEKKLPYDKSLKVPSCIKGKRACPPEDCGGVWGYEELLEVMKNPSHPEYENMLEWLGGEIDSEYFDREEVNKRLAKCAK
jgi:hypothetical protein